MQNLTVHPLPFFYRRTSFGTALIISFFTLVSSAFAQNYHGRRGAESYNDYQKSFFSFLFPTIKGSKVPLESVRTVKPFHAVVIEDPFRVIFRQGKEQEVRVISDDNLPEYIKTTVGTDGVLTIALDVQNYLFDTLAVVITTPNIDAISLGLGTKARFEAPFSLPALTSTMGIASDFTFQEGFINKHTIRADGIGANIDASEVLSNYASVRMPGVGVYAKIYTKNLELIGNFGMGADLSYVIGEDGRKPEITGDGGKGVGVEIRAIPMKPRVGQTKPLLPPQAPLPLGPKN